MIRLGIAIHETWSFFNEIYSFLEDHYQTNLFKKRWINSPIFRERINRKLFQHDLSNLLRNNDVVFFEWASELLVAATKLPKVSGIVTRLHRYEMYQWVDQVNWSVVDKIIVVSQAKKEEFTKKFPDQAQKIIVSSPSISLEKFSIQPKQFHGDIGILCHLTPRKRVYDLILDFYELSKIRDNVYLHIAGGMDPDLKDYFLSLQDLVQDLNLNEKVTFYGNVTDPWNWYHKIDIFISNSYSEGLQVALMEAMGSGCFCLSHRWRGAEEMLPDENLYFSGKEMLAKIIHYCDLPDDQKNDIRDEMRAKACSLFDINQTISQIDDVIKAVAASRKIQS